MTYAAMLAAINADPAASFWLKGAIAYLDKRDPLDACRDAELLVKLQQTRLAEALNDQLGA